MKKRNGFKKRLHAALELPDDLDPHRVLLTWAGREKLLVEQHRGIDGLSETEIRFQSEQGTFVIAGKEMELCELSNTRALIAGKMDAIFFSEES